MRPAWWKRWCSGLSRSLGLEVRRVGGLRMDPIADQIDFLAGHEVATIFDVGAFVGSVAVEYAERFPRATVHAFEPFAHSFGELTLAAARQPRIIAHPMAVSDSVGQRTLHLTGNASSNSLLPVNIETAGRIDPEWFASAGAQAVQVTTVDSFCQAHSIEQIDILKIDVQGVELQVLQGAQNMLSRGAIPLIYCEFICERIYQSDTRLSQLFGLLESKGYVLAGLYNLMYFRRKQPIGQFDAIFIRTEPKSGQAR